MSSRTRGRRPASCALAFFLFALATQAQTLPQEYRNLIRSDSNVGALDASLLGDRVDYYTGHVDFAATDVSLPGNSALPVAVGRRYAVQANPSGVIPERAFGDWDIEVPHIEGVVATSVGWTVPGANPNARCSAFAGAPSAAVTTPSIANPGTTVTTTIPWEQYATGYQLAVPGYGRRELLQRAQANNEQPTSGSYPIVTNDWWMVAVFRRSISTAQARAKASSRSRPMERSTRSTGSRRVRMYRCHGPPTRWSPKSPRRSIAPTRG